MYLCCVASLSLFRLQFFKLRPLLKIGQNLKKSLYHAFFKKWAKNDPQFLLHFLIDIDVLMMCSQFELIPTSIFQVTATFKNRPKSEKITVLYSPCLFSKKWAKNDPQFLLHFLIHIDVLMLCSKFEPISSSIFQVTATFKNRPKSEKITVL